MTRGFYTRLPKSKHNKHLQTRMLLRRRKKNQIMSHRHNENRIRHRMVIQTVFSNLNRQNRELEKNEILMNPQLLSKK